MSWHAYATRILHRKTSKIFSIYIAFRTTTFDRKLLKVGQNINSDVKENDQTDMKQGYGGYGKRRDWSVYQCYQKQSMQCCCLESSKLRPRRKVYACCEPKHVYTLRQPLFLLRHLLILLP